LGTIFDSSKLYNEFNSLNKLKALESWAYLCMFKIY